MSKPSLKRPGNLSASTLATLLALSSGLAIARSAPAATAETWSGTWNAPNLWRAVELTLRPGAQDRSTFAVGTARGKIEATVAHIAMDDTSLTVDLEYAGAVVRLRGRVTGGTAAGDLEAVRGAHALTRGKWTLERRGPSDLKADRILANVRKALGFPGALASGFTVEETAAGDKPSTWAARVGPGGEIAVDEDGRPSLIFDGTGLRLNRAPFGWMPADGRLREKTLLAEVVRSGAWMLDVPAWKRTAWTVGEGAARRYVVGITMGDGLVPAYVVVDPATWRPERAAVAWDAGERSFVFADYAAPSGVLVPTMVTSGYRGREQAWTTTRVGAGAGTFAMPAAEGVSYDTAASPILEGVDGEGGGGHLFVRPTVEGRDLGWFHVDTGAPFNMLDTRVADSLGLEMVGSMGPRSIRILKELRVGQLVLRNQPVMVTDLSTFSAPDSAGRAGVIGGPVFEHAIVTFDYPGKRLSVFSPEAFHERVADWESLSLEGPPVIEASFDGAKDRFYIDTGKSGTVSFMSQAAAAAGLLTGRTFTEAENETVEGTSFELVTHLESFTVGGEKFQDPEVRIKPPGTTNDELGSVAGYVGRGFFGDRRVIFDYAGGRIAFVK